MGIQTSVVLHVLRNFHYSIVNEKQALVSNSKNSCQIKYGYPDVCIKKTKKNIGHITMRWPTHEKLYILSVFFQPQDVTDPL